MRGVLLLSRWFWPTLAALLALIPFAGGFSTRNVFFVRDLGMYFWPRHLWHWRTIRARDWPLWDPYIGGGQSAVADALNQFFLLPATLIRLLLPPVPGFNFWVAAPFPILAIGAWVWLRRRFSSPAAFVGAVVATFSGPILSTGNFANFSWTVAAVPWILWCADRLVERPVVPRFAALAAFVGLQALAGEPVTFAATSALVVAYVAIALPVDGRRPLTARLTWTAVAIVTGLLLAAVQLMPLFEAVSRSLRSVGIDDTFWSFHPLATLDIIVPHVFGHPYWAEVHTFPWMKALNSDRESLFYSVYVGLGACALAAVRPHGSAMRRWRMFWWVVCGIALLSAFGRFTFVYPALQRLVPILETFRFPIKYLVISAFALAALAAAGADALLTYVSGADSMARPRPATLLLSGVAAVAAVFGVAGLLGASWMQSFWTIIAALVGIDDSRAGAQWMMEAAAPLWLRLSVTAALMLFLLAIAWRRHRLAPLAAWTLCGVAVVDPMAVNYGLHPTMAAEELGPPEWLAATRAHPQDRVYIGGRVPKTPTTMETIDAPRRFPVPLEWDVQQALARVFVQFAHTPAAWGIRELLSTDLPQLWPREYTTMLRTFRNATPAARQRFLRRTGTRYCLVPEPPDAGAAPLSSPPVMDPMALYECHASPQPRAYISDAVSVEPDLRRHLERLFDEGHDPFRTALLEREPPAAAGDPGAPSTPSAHVIRGGNTELVVSADAGPAGGYLNVLDSYDPWWIVDVDGRRAPLLRANGIFRAVRLAPGRHDVRLRYRPVPFYIGMAVSGLTAALLLVSCVYHLRRPARWQAP